jgi:acyl-CoA dehydrogenase
VGYVCKGEIDGKEVVGIRLSWDKRYITLAPVATVLGLAFRLYDPDGLLGDPDKSDYGITAALIPTDLPGVEIGRRHLPLTIPFSNGPTRGKDVFVPLDTIIGGPDMAGQGWPTAGSASSSACPSGTSRASRRSSLAWPAAPTSRTRPVV